MRVLSIFAAGGKLNALVERDDRYERLYKPSRSSTTRLQNLLRLVDPAGATLTNIGPIVWYEFSKEKINGNNSN